MRVRCAVMEGSEPLVPWHFQITVIAFEIAVMHLVVERSKRQTVPVLDQDTFKAGMRCSGSQGLMLHVKQDVNRMRRDDPVNQDR